MVGVEDMDEKLVEDTDEELVSKNDKEALVVYDNSPDRILPTESRELYISIDLNTLNSLLNTNTGSKLHQTLDQAQAWAAARLNNRCSTTVAILTVSQILEIPQLPVTTRYLCKRK